MIVAVFDFDNTLTTRDSLLYFLVSRFGYQKIIFSLLPLAHLFIGVIIGLVSRQELKERVLAKFFNNEPIENLKKWGKQFADKKLDEILNPKMMNILRWHQQKGHFCVIATASPDIYIYPWAERYKFNTVLCSRLEISANKRFTGKLAGLNCRGPEKVRRLIEEVGPKSSYYLYAYGDSRGDRELMELADAAHWV